MNVKVERFRSRVRRVETPISIVFKVDFATLVNFRNARRSPLYIVDVTPILLRSSAKCHGDVRINVKCDYAAGVTRA